MTGAAVVALQMWRSARHGRSENKSENKKHRGFKSIEKRGRMFQAKKMLRKKGELHLLQAAVSGSAGNTQLTAKACKSATKSRLQFKRNGR